MNKLIVAGSIASVSSMPVHRLAQDSPRVVDRIWDKDASYHRENQYQEGNPELSWGMGNGQGTEKQDAIWTAAHNAATSEKFDFAMANNAGKMTAGNSHEPEPNTGYFTGAYAQRDMGQIVDAPIFKWYADGKGDGSEKQDAFWDIAHNAANAAQFDKDAAYFPGITSGNGGDAAPSNKYFSSQQMGFAQVQGPPPADAWRPSVYETREKGQQVREPVFNWYTNGNGAGSEKEDFAKDIARQAATPEQFHRDTAYFPGIHAGHKDEAAPSTQYFNGDQAGASLAASFVQAYGPPAPEGQYAWRKSVYPTRGVGQPFPNIDSTEGAGAPIFKQWTNGNGLGSEKEDFAKDIERNSNGDTGKFHKDTAYFPGVAAYSGHDTEPVGNNYGGPEFMGN